MNLYLKYKYKYKDKIRRKLTRSINPLYSDRILRLVCRMLYYVAKQSFTLRRNILEFMIEQHPCWAGGFSSEGICAQPCDRCDPIRNLANERIL